MSDHRFMGMALEVARRGAGRTAPNPMVGAVIVADGQVIAEGWTQPPGQDHAEPHALRQIGGRAPGATLYVTLEPCCHHGRTPPCTDSILASGITRVVIGTGDPFPLVSGKGITILREAGIDVTVGVREAECQRLNLGFLRSVQGGLPEVVLKAAITLDGRIASAFGESRWITGPAARDQGHRLRDAADAVIVGMGTVLADDPLLTTRIPGGRDAVAVVLDTELRIPDSAKLLARRETLIFTANPGRALPVEVIGVPRGPGGLDVRAVLRTLAERGLHHVLVEGGGKVHHAMLSAGVVDRIELFISPRVLGEGPGFVRGGGWHLSDAPSFQVVRTAQLGDDLHLCLERPT